MGEDDPDSAVEADLTNGVSAREPIVGSSVRYSWSIRSLCINAESTVGPPSQVMRRRPSEWRLSMTSRELPVPVLTIFAPELRKSPSNSFLLEFCILDAGVRIKGGDAASLNTRESGLRSKDLDKIAMGAGKES